MNLYSRVIDNVLGRYMEVDITAGETIGSQSPICIRMPSGPREQALIDTLAGIAFTARLTETLWTKAVSCNMICSNKDTEGMQYEVG